MLCVRVVLDMRVGKRVLGTCYVGERYGGEHGDTDDADNTDAACYQ